MPVPAYLNLGLKFSADVIDPPLPPVQGPLDNVVTLSAQYRWLAEKSKVGGLQLEPGPAGPNRTYAVEPFKAKLDAVLARLGIEDPGINYTALLSQQDHIIRDGAWFVGSGHIFTLLADGVPLQQEAYVGGQGFQVEILMSLEV